MPLSVEDTLMARAAELAFAVAHVAAEMRAACVNGENVVARANQVNRAFGLFPARGDGVAHARRLSGLELVDRATLMKRADDLAHPTLRALTEITERIRSDVVVQRRHRIFVLWGLPRTALLGILAHELFHVWQTTQGGTRPGAEAAFREGAANYAQYRVLNSLGAQRWARQLHDDPDPVYGKGLRRFLRMVEVEGEPAALRLATRRDRFPPGY